MLGVAVFVASTFLLSVGAPDAAAAAPPTSAPSASTTVPSVASSGAYTPVTRSRCCDTRTSESVPANQCNDNSTGAGSDPITQLATRLITIDGFGPVPAS